MLLTGEGRPNQDYAELLTTHLKEGDIGFRRPLLKLAKWAREAHVDAVC